MKKFYLVKVIVLLLPFSVFSQLSITVNDTATALAQSLEGSGVTISNATLNCNPQGAGIFSYTGSNLGLNNGVLLTTGSAAEAANPGTYFCDVSTGNYFQDSDLISIDQDAYNDVCILQFDAVPDGDTMFVINYVFGSEEYPTYVNQFNDAFAFFFTGSNPAGGNYNATNVATLPGGIPVSINDVNNGTNPSFFHNNYTVPNSDIAYDGYTIPITSYVPVVPFTSYHIKIAIADAIDEAFDSGVFLTQNSFVSNHRGMTTNINFIKNDNTLLAYPNPTNGLITIKHRINLDEASLQLIEMSSGKTILLKKIAYNSSQTQIDLSELANGVYSLNLIGNIITPENLKVVKIK